MDSHLPGIYNFFKFHTALIMELFDAIMILKISQKMSIFGQDTTQKFGFQLLFNQKTNKSCFHEIQLQYFLSINHQRSLGTGAQKYELLIM